MTGQMDGWASRTNRGDKGTTRVFDSVGWGNHYGTWTWIFFPSDNPHANPAIDSDKRNSVDQWVMQEYRNHPIWHPPVFTTDKQGKTTLVKAGYWEDHFTWDDISSGDVNALLLQSCL